MRRMRNFANFLIAAKAIAEAIIDLLLVFLEFKEFESYWGAVFLRLGEPLWFCFFFINQKRKPKFREQNLKKLFSEQIRGAEKTEWFVFSSFRLKQSEESRCEKFTCSEKSF